MAPRVEIEYCTGCRWLLRAGWTAQELLTTFEAELGAVTLIPGSGGVFDVRVGGGRRYGRARTRGVFPNSRNSSRLFATTLRRINP